MIQSRSYKYRIYPNQIQENLLNQTFGSVWFYWNYLLDSFIKKEKSKTERELRQEHVWLKLISSASLQQKKRDFESTKKQLFSKTRKKKLGKLKFKKKGKTRDSYRLPNQKFSIDYNKQLIKLEKIGYVPIIIDRPIPDSAKINNCTVSRNKANQFFVSISVLEEINPLPLTNKFIGLDLGIKDLFTTSNGWIASNPLWFRKNQTKLAKAQRHLARKQIGSNRFKKQKLKVAKIHNKITNQRNYYLHNLSTNLIRNYDLIAIEDLNIEGMKQKFGKSVSDSSLAEFIRQLSYKALYYGKTLIKINRYFPSTQLCSHCGNTTGPKGLSQLGIRNWICSSCGTDHNRDENAAINILKEGYKILTSVELVEYERGEDVRQVEGRKFVSSDHLQFSMKRLQFNVII